MIRQFSVALALVVLCVCAEAQTNPNQWVDELKNQLGNVCCFDNDGRRLNGPDWDTLGKVSEDPNGTSGYRVYDEGQWRDVINMAVVTMKNRDGIARVWFAYQSDSRGTIKVVRCFLPGALS